MFVNVSGTASVLEVIEPSSSDEGEVKTDWPITIFPSRSEDPASSMITITSGFNRHSARSSSQATSSSVRSSRYSLTTSPTKRLLEMGISARVLNDEESAVAAVAVDDDDEVVYVHRKKKLPTTFKPPAISPSAASYELPEDEMKKQTFLQKMNTNKCKKFAML